MRTRLWTFLMAGAVTLSAQAQLRLPALPLPALPLQTQPLQGLSQTLDSADARTLERLGKLRRTAVERLVRANRRVIDTDPNGEPIVRNEVLALSPSDQALERARAAGFLVAREQTDDSAGLRLVVLTAPSGMSTERALETLRAVDPEGLYDYNHLYLSSGAWFDEGETAAPATPAASSPAATSAKAVPAATAPSRAAAPDTLAAPATSTVPAAINALSTSTMPTTHLRVGLLDTGIDASHPIFKNSVIHAWGCANKPIPATHGTAVASLLLVHGSAELYAADVYCGSPLGGAVDAIVAALVWMTREQVPVVNVSLVGPKNLLLERAVAALVTRGYLIVAAVGNDGPSAPPLYPAAYANVVGVTGVDSKRRVLIEALRGPQVMFAAPGADIEAANVEHGYADVRGTSFAAPTVAGMLAELLSAPDEAAAELAVESLARRAIDLGAPGRDLTYGFGLVLPAAP